ncbi:hypothetical protein EVG20_g9180, partial [Dentipellis fragilis]
MEDNLTNALAATEQHVTPRRALCNNEDGDMTVGGRRLGEPGGREDEAAGSGEAAVDAARERRVASTGANKGRQAKPVFRSSSPLESPLSPPKPSLKRPLKERLSFTNQPTKRPRLERSSDASSSKQKPKHDTKSSQTLTQLHFSIDTTVLRTCALCDLTYTKGAPDDESLHKSHCSRVLKGMEWGREEEKESVKMGVQEIASSVKLKSGKKGRIICVRATAGGRIGSKLAILLETISLTLSSPPLTSDILAASKVYLFLLPSPTSAAREKIVGCVIAQHITSAMEIVSPSDIEPPSSPDTPPLTATLVPVDTSSGLFCHPKPLP